jgi:sodium transport system permease protein
MGLTVFCMSPGVELTPQYSILPVAGVTLLLKGLLLSPFQAGSLSVYVLPVLATSLGYSALALWWAIDQFQKEDVLFREGERFEFGLWVRHLLRDKEATPSFAEAGFCFVLIMLLQFFSLRFLQGRLAVTDAADRGTLLFQLILVQQLAIIAAPALFMGLILTTSVRQTFRLHWPGAKAVGAAIVLPVVLHPFSVEALARLEWFFGDVPPGAREVLATMADSRQPLALILFAFAFVPAVCEETAFRGFILSGLSRKGRTALAIVLSSAAFGVMHMIPQQVFNTTLLGLVMGLLTIRSNSLLPCIAFHFVNNTLGVLHARLGSAAGGYWPGNPFVYWEGGALRYQLPTLVVCGAIAVFLLARLAGWQWRRSSERGTEPPQDRGVAFAGTNAARE